MEIVDFLFVILATEGEKMMTNIELNKSETSGGPQQKVSDDSTKATAVCIPRLLEILVQFK